MNAGRLLGWVSMAIGAAEVLAPGKIASLLGIEQRSQHHRTTRLLGARELMHGASLLAQRSTTGRKKALWGRVAGDVLDTGVLAVAAAKSRRPMRFAIVTTGVLAIGAIDLYCAARRSRHDMPSS